MAKTTWIDRQIDDALLMVSAATATAYARRQAKRHLPKVIVVGGALVAAAGTAALAATAVGVIGAGGAGALWYRKKKQAAPTWYPAAPQPAEPQPVASG